MINALDFEGTESLPADPMDHVYKTVARWPEPDFILGIDPGASGAVAVLDASTGTIVECFHVPTYCLLDSKGRKTGKRRIDTRALAVRLIPYVGHRAVIEEVGAMPGQGVSSTFSFGEAFGVVKGLCAALDIDVTLARPQAWQKPFGLGADKSTHRFMAQALWPLRADLFKRIKDDGPADAALIAEFGRKLRESSPRDCC